MKVAKLCGNYRSIVALNESGTSSEDTLQKVIELFNSKHPKQNAFVFIHCWLIFKDVLRCLRWSKTKKENKMVMLMKRKMLMDVGTFGSLDEYLDIEIGIKHTNDYNERKVLKRPQGSCATKDKLKNHAMRECALKAQVKSTIDMAAITLKKDQIMENQNTLTLFMIIEKQMLNSKAQKYLKL
jgi:hypothetical protein